MRFRKWALVIAMLACVVAYMVYTKAQARKRRADSRLSELQRSADRLFYPENPPQSMRDFQKFGFSGSVEPDPWNNPYRMEREDSGKLAFVSNGPDGRPGTGDDIKRTTQQTFDWGTPLQAEFRKLCSDYFERYHDNLHEEDPIHQDEKLAKLVERAEQLAERLGEDAAIQIADEVWEVKDYCAGLSRGPFGRLPVFGGGYENAFWMWGKPPEAGTQND